MNYELFSETFNSADTVIYRKHSPKVDYNNRTINGGVKQITYSNIRVTCANFFIIADTSYILRDVRITCMRALFFCFDHINKLLCD